MPSRFCARGCLLRRRLLALEATSCWHSSTRLGSYISSGARTADGVERACALVARLAPRVQPLRGSFLGFGIRAVELGWRAGGVRAEGQRVQKDVPNRRGNHEPRILRHKRGRVQTSGAVFVLYLFPNFGNKGGNCACVCVVPMCLVWATQIGSPSTLVTFVFLGALKTSLFSVWAGPSPNRTR